MKTTLAVLTALLVVSACAQARAGFSRAPALLSYAPVRAQSAPSAADGAEPAQFRLSLEYGYSQMVNNDPDTLPRIVKDLNDNLRLASNFILSMSTYFRRNVGIGLFYSRYTANASLTAYGLSIDSDNINGRYHEKISVNYFGPCLSYKTKPRWRHLVAVADLRPGLVLFFDDVRLPTLIRNLSSPVFGLGGSLGIEYLLDNGVGLGLSVNGLYATVSELTDAQGLSRPVDKNLSRLDLNVGVKYHFQARSKK